MERKKLNKLIQIIKKFYHKIKKENKLLLKEKVDYPFEEGKIKEIEFKEKLNVKANREILKLQEEYEKGNVTEDELSMTKLKELVHLYKKQIDDLNTEITMKKIKLKQI